VSGHKTFYEGTDNCILLYLDFVLLIEGEFLYQVHFGPWVNFGSTMNFGLEREWTGFVSNFLFVVTLTISPIKQCRYS
jgi:hypothetical protein